MGNREALLAAARRCLYERGFARTTARDVATGAGVSLAAIGYHFGTKDALLSQAVLAALREWGEQIGAAVSGAVRAGLTPQERFETAWAQVIRSFSDSAPLWRIQYELLGSAHLQPELREAFAAANQAGREGLVAMFGPETDAAGAPLPAAEILRIGTFYQAVLAGIGSQWLIDPDQALTGDALLSAVRAIAAGVPAGP